MKHRLLCLTYCVFTVALIVACARDTQGDTARQLAECLAAMLTLFGAVMHARRME